MSMKMTNKWVRQCSDKMSLCFVHFIYTNDTKNEGNQIHLNHRRIIIHLSLCVPFVLSNHWICKQTKKKTLFFFPFFLWIRFHVSSIPIQMPSFQLKWTDIFSNENNNGRLGRDHDRNQVASRDCLSWVRDYFEYFDYYLSAAKLKWHEDTIELLRFTCVSITGTSSRIRVRPIKWRCN